MRLGQESEEIFISVAPQIEYPHMSVNVVILDRVDVKTSVTKLFHFRNSDQRVELSSAIFQTE